MNLYSFIQLCVVVFVGGLGGGGGKSLCSDVRVRVSSGVESKQQSYLWTRHFPGDSGCGLKIAVTCGMSYY